MIKNHARKTIPFPTTPFSIVETDADLEIAVHNLVMDIARARSKKGRMVKSLSFDQGSDGRYGWTVEYYAPSFEEDQ